MSDVSSDFLSWPLAQWAGSMLASFRFAAMLRSLLQLSGRSAARHAAVPYELRISEILSKALAVTAQASHGHAMTRCVRSFSLGSAAMGRSRFHRVFGSFARSGFASSRGFGADAADKKDDETITEEVGETERERDAGEDDDVEKLRAEVSEASAQVKDLNEKLLRTLADMENLRERTRRQTESAEKFAIQGFCKDLLDVADNLGRAVSTVDAGEGDAEKTKAMLTSLHQGVLMVEKQLASTFSKHGVEKYDPTGDAFDPNDHMALFNVPVVEGKEAGTVAAVTKVGYRLHGRTIRAAEVGVYQA